MKLPTIGDALFSKTQQRVLGLFYGKPDIRFYTNEVLRSVAMGRGTVLRELERLETAGLLLKVRDGNQIYYQANGASPVYPELLGLVRKTFGVMEVIRAALQPLDEQIEAALIFGSMAKNTDVASSDIDLMIVGDDISYSDVMNLLVPLETVLMRPVNPVLYSVSEFTAKLGQGSTFLSRVMAQPVWWVKGSKDDIGVAGESGADRPVEDRRS